MTDFALGGRGKSARYRLRANVTPETWTHLTLNIADFSDATGKIPPADTVWELSFGGAADGSAEHYALIDNLKVKK